MTGDQSARQGWLFGPGADLMLGCGGAYIALFALLVVAGDRMLALIPLGLLPLLTLFTGTPHVGATLLRVYERGEDRSRYALVSLWATVLVGAAFVLGVYDLRIGSWLITAYLAWSPWHFTAQNYGIAMMFMKRRGVEVTAGVKRLVFWSFTFSWILVFLSMNGDAASTLYAPYGPDGIAYRFISLGLPLAINVPLLAIALLGYVVCLVGAALVLLRRASWRALGPSALLLLVQALWFSFPVVARNLGLFTDLVPISRQHAEYSLLWIMFGHSVQYLWITTFFAFRSGAESRGLPYLTKSLLAGGAIWGVPLLLFGPDLFGARAVDAGLFLLVAAAVNVHHFILDGVIWRLRSGRIAGILLRDREESLASFTAAPRRRRSWIRPLVWAAGALYAVLTIVGTLEIEFGIRRADPTDVIRLRSAAERLRLIGRDHPQVRYNLGVLAMQAGELETGRSELERSLSLGPTADAWAALGLLHEERGRAEDARAAYDAALALDPDNVLALFQSALLRRAAGDHERAERELARAETAQRRVVARQPEEPGAEQRLRQILAVRADQDEAIPRGDP
jgi:hypothetical protein